MIPPPIRPPYRVEPLGKHHDRAAFSCGVALLDRYLHEAAGQDGRRGLARCFVLVHPEEPARVLGYYTLSNAQIVRDSAPTKLRKTPYSAIPALLIGRLAVAEELQGRGWGSRLLLHALWHIDRISSESGFALVLVDPIDDRAADFYRRFGFRPLPGSKRLYLLLKDLRQTLAALPRPQTD